MTIKKIIAQLKKLKYEIVDLSCTSEYAREHAYFDVEDAIKQLKENYEG